MGARNTFAATRRSHAILKRLRHGEGVTIEEVSQEYDIQYPQARADLKLLEELYDLGTRRDGRTKVWYMPGKDTREAVVSVAAALELGAVALDLFKDTGTLFKVRRYPLLFGQVIETLIIDVGQVETANVGFVEQSVHNIGLTMAMSHKGVVMLAGKDGIQQRTPLQDLQFNLNTHLAEHFLN